MRSVWTRFEALVLPRLLGLMIALPYLTLVADIVGLMGGALLCRLSAGHTDTQYLTRGERGNLAEHVLGRAHNSIRCLQC